MTQARRLSFISIDRQWIDGRGDLVIVLCDQDRPGGAAELLGKTIYIDGAPYIVLRTEGPRPYKPVRQGEKLGLWVTSV